MKKISIGTVLLYLAAFFQSTQFARAFHEIDSNSKYSEIGGLIAGIVVNVSLAYSANRLPKIRGKAARKYANIAFWTLIILTPIFLAPINYKTMGSFYDDIPAIKVLLSIISASVVDVAISLVAFADGSLISSPTNANDAGAIDSVAGAKKNDTLATGKTRSANSKRDRAKKKEKDSEKIYTCECGFETKNRYEYSGHSRTCEVHKKAKEIKNGEKDE